MEVGRILDNLQHRRGMDHSMDRIPHRHADRAIIRNTAKRGTPNVRRQQYTQIRKMKSYITDNNNKAILSEQMKIIELIDADYRLLSIIMRLDITLPFGDISVEQMCRRYDMSPTLFLMICRVYSDEDYTPDIEGLNIGDMLHLIRVSAASHRYYLDHMIPRITQWHAACARRVRKAPERHPAPLLRKLYRRGGGPSCL